MRSRNNDNRNRGLVIINFIIQLLIFMSIFALIGITIQSTLVISLGFILSIIITLLISFFRIHAGIIYIISIPIMIILLIVMPKILS
ncbi:MAG: hypothetical protein ACRC57_09090 [Sarcina sp.]